MNHDVDSSIQYARMQDVVQEARGQDLSGQPRKDIDTNALGNVLVTSLNLSKRIDISAAACRDVTFTDTAIHLTELRER